MPCWNSKELAEWNSDLSYEKASCGHVCTGKESRELNRGSVNGSEFVS